MSLEFTADRGVASHISLQHWLVREHVHDAVKTMFYEHLRIAVAQSEGNVAPGQADFSRVCQDMTQNTQSLEMNRYIVR